MKEKSSHDARKTLSSSSSSCSPAFTFLSLCLDFHVYLLCCSGLLKRHKFHFGFGILIYKINIDYVRTRMAELNLQQIQRKKVLKTI